MIPNEIIVLLQKLINSQSWNLKKAYDYMGEKDYNDVWEAMIYAKDLITFDNIKKEKKNARIKKS